MLGKSFPRCLRNFYKIFNLRYKIPKMYVDIYSFLSRVINKILRYFEGRGARVRFSWYLDWFFLKWLSLLLKDIMTRHFRFVIILSIISFIFVDHALYIIHEFIYFFYVFFFFKFLRMSLSLLSYYFLNRTRAMWVFLCV